MDLSMLKAALVFHFLLCQQVDSSTSSISKYQLSNEEIDSIEDTDNDLKIFFNNFKMAYLEKRVPRHITIVGPSAEDLPQIQLLLESYPSIICTEPKTCVYRSWFSRGSFVIIFLDDLREDTFERNLDILSLCAECKVLYILRGIIQTAGISSIFVKTMRDYGVIAQLAHLDKNVTKFYGSSMAKNCSIESQLIMTWRPGVAFDFIDTWTSGLHDLNGCLVTVSSLNFEPTMLIEKHKNNSLTIAGGLEGHLILALAEKLNFTVKLTSPSAKEQRTYSRKTSILLAVATEKAEIGIGRLRPTSGTFNNRIAFSTAYDQDCVTWAVPSVVTHAENIVWMEFSWPVWVLVGLVFAVSCMIGSASHNIETSPNSNEKKDTALVATILEVVAIHVGSPVVHVPYSIGGKFLLMICLQYATVMTTAYKTSLASILTTDDGLPGIVDAEGILAANLSIGGASYHLDFLKDQVDGNETISKLIDRFVVMNKPSEVMNRLKFDDKFAGISRQSALVYEKYKLVLDRKPTSFDIFNDCVLRHETAIVFPKTSPLRGSVDVIIRRLAEFGIPSHWDSGRSYLNENTKRESREENHFKISVRNKFTNIFLFYLSCMVLCLLAFLIEMGTSISHNSKKIIVISV